METHIRPDTDEDRDQREYRNHHMVFFGHLPEPDAYGRCQHPIHAAVRRAMNGATFRIDFDPREIVSDDSYAQHAYDEGYQRRYREAKQRIAEIEEEETYDNARAAGLILLR